jgi:catalase
MIFLRTNLWNTIENGMNDHCDMEIQTWSNEDRVKNLFEICSNTRLDIVTCVSILFVWKLMIFVWMNIHYVLINDYK